jgi:hypothetical protein
MEKQAQAFQDLADDTAAQAEMATDLLAIALRAAATQFRTRATEGADIAVPADLEPQKRDAIALWRETANRLDALALGVEKVWPTGNMLANEIAEMLVNGLDRWLEQPVADRPPLAELMRERARNIAQAYQGRVLPEGK